MVHSLLVDSSTEAVNQEDFMEVMYLVTKMGKIITSKGNCEYVVCLHVDRTNQLSQIDQIRFFL